MAADVDVPDPPSLGWKPAPSVVATLRVVSHNGGAGVEAYQVRRGRRSWTVSADVCPCPACAGITPALSVSDLRRPDRPGVFYDASSAISALDDARRCVALAGK